MNELTARYEALKEKVSERWAEFAELMKFVETETEYLTAPASTKFHLCKEGGLLEHSVNVAEHIYMFGGESVIVKLITDTYMMDDLVDWFGRDFHVRVEENGKMLVTLKCNESAMKYWALQYGECIEILSPNSLRESIVKIVQGMLGKYRANVEGNGNE